MRTPLLRDTPSSHSWLTRVRENLAQLIAPSGLTPSASNGAPIHLLKLERTGKSGSAQTVSLMTHAGIMAALLFLATRAPVRDALSISSPPESRASLTFAPPKDFTSRASLGHGGGGDNNPVPPTHGYLAPRSAIQLASPRLPDHLDHPLPVEVTIWDPHAPPNVAPVSNLGLPWMTNDTDSAGPGNRGIGSAGTGGMGDRDGSGGGEGEDGVYSPGTTAPVCSVCPLPLYTDEARHVKVQGTVTLRVLVGADGKASQIRVVRGIGYGLDERAIETVRGWKFRPARDAAHRAIAAWVTIEAIFRLF
jgi:periplasmic protein TonB